MNNEEKLAGILGTVIIHLAAAIIFMSFKLHSLDSIKREQFTIEFTPVEETEEQKRLVELPHSTQGIDVKAVDDEMTNIIRNLANTPDPTIDRDAYIDKVKEELIKSGKLAADNFIDEKKNRSDQQDEVIPEEDAGKDSLNLANEAEKMAASYQGPTRIYYNLVGRNHTFLPVPIYKCEGSGKVVLTIGVNQKGIVETAEVSVSESTTSETCLIETAVQSALRSRFNADSGAPKVQTGTLTYHFVAQ